jgi:3-phenylpropionate/cinnamic acid dioxygenase small subunit
VADSEREIATLLYRYADCVDRGDFAGVGELFADATYRAVVGDDIATFKGRDAVRECLSSMVITYDGVPGTKHVTTNLMVEVDEGSSSARAQSYYTVLQARPDLPLQVVTAGRYEDSFERVAGSWRFSDRLIHFELQGDLSRHLRSVP